MNDCRYKFALACIKLKKNRDAEKALLGDPQSVKLNMPLQQLAEKVPNGSYGLYLLGLIYERQQKFNDSKEYFSKALELNPTLWSAYEKICKHGELLSPSKIFAASRYKSYEDYRLSQGGSFGFSAQ